ncbi:MAG TPA: glycosyltransferase [Pseudomonadota bacterium]|nr:glycosyltransferase [Pseudomonadota bacterium]
MDTKPVVSVMMPVFNAGGFVEQAAGSILGQTMRDLELIVIDDGSTDVSAMILRRLAVEDRRVRFLSRKNEGIVATRNQVLSMARADLVACMDADDISHPQRLARQVRYMKEHPECVALGSAIVVVDPEGQPIKAPPVALTHAEIDAQLLCGYGWALVQPSAMMRRDAVEKIGGYRAKYDLVEDLDLFLRLAEVGSLANLPEPLLRFRQHFQSTCVTHASEQTDLKVEVVRETYLRRGLPVPEPLVLPKETRLTGCAQHLSWASFALGQGKFRQAARHLQNALRTVPKSPHETWELAHSLVDASRAAWQRRRAFSRLPKPHAQIS